MLTDGAGAWVYRAEYDPHGQILAEFGGATYLDSRKFTGYERDWATNLDYAKARTYHHNRGRFMQADPLGLGAAEATDPLSLNLYSYVGNDPANFVDPSGLNLELPSGSGEKICFRLHYKSTVTEQGYWGDWVCFGGNSVSGGWTETGDDYADGDDGATPTQDKPPVKSICGPNTPKWDEAVKAFNMVLDPLGYSYAIKDNEWQVIPKGNPVSYNVVVQKAITRGWRPYININPQHWGGLDFEHYYNGMWFHLTIGRPWLSSSPPPWVDIHCEQLFQPSSREHAKDWWNKHVILPIGDSGRRPFWRPF